MSKTGASFAFGSLIVVGLFLPAGPIYAGTITESHTFQTADQSMWGPGSAFNFNFNEFLGVDLDTGNQSAGGVTCDI
jgi:hypothetical protein